MNAQAREKIIADEITNGNYTKALDVIDNILKKKITIKAELNLLTFKAKIFFRQGKFDESYVVAQTIAEKSFKNNLPLYNIYADIFQINFFTVKNNFDPILNMILLAKEKLTKINNLSENEKKAVEAGLLYYRSHYFEYHGQYDQALENCFASYTIFKELNQFDELTSTLESLSTYYRIKGEYQKALELLDEALIVQENIKNPIHLGIINKNMGLIFAFKGDLTKGLIFLNKALDFLKPTENVLEIASLYNGFGVIYEFQGDLDKAFMFYSDALNLYKKLKLKLQTTSMNYNIGGILRKKGSFDSALEYFNQALHSYQELGNPQTIAAVFNVIGKTYHQKSDLEQAKIHLQAALQLRESVKNNLSISRTLYLLILVCIDKGELDLAENYLNELLIIDKKESNKTIAIRALTANAIFLKTKKRTTHRAKAEEILKNIVSSEVSDHEVTIDALINLIELLISELHLTNDINVLNELKDYIQKLLEIAKKQHSLLIFADMYWLQSQIALIELDILRAKAFLSQALITSEEIGYKQLAMKISFEYDKLLDELDSWESVIGKEMPISERMDKLKLEEFFVNNILKRKFDGLQLPNEEPVMLIFTSSVGKPIFTKKFHIGKELMDDSLISGFLMAFNSFMNQTFESKGLFDRIKHKEYTIIIQNIDSIIICYIFKGQSFTALQKVIQLINKLQQDEKLFNILENCIDSSKPLSNILVNSLEKIIDPIFV